MPLILSGSFFLVLVLSKFGLPSSLPFWDPWSFCYWARLCLGPQLATFWFLFLFLVFVVVGYLEGGAMLDTLTLKS